MDILNISSKGKVTTLTDNQGVVDIFIKIPKFKISDVIIGGATNTHPAFIVNGVEKDYIYIAKYMAGYDENKRCCSLPFLKPIDSINYAEAKVKCSSKGNGYHMITLAEWSALILYCYKNGLVPFGNNNNGLACLEDNTILGSVTSNPKIWYGGTGGAKCSHDLTSDGIDGVSGNVSSYIQGVRTLNNEIQLTTNNDIALNPNVEYKAILADGTYVAENTVNSIKFRAGGIHNDGSNTKLDNHFATMFRNGLTVSPIFEVMTLLPQAGQTNTEDRIFADPAPTGKYQYCSVGGNFGQGVSSGIFYKRFNVDTFVGDGYGFRFAYVQP